VKHFALVKGLAALLLLATAAGAPLSFATATGTPSQGNATLGKALFSKKNCAQCHKADGSGGIKLTGNATPNWKSAKTWADPKRATDDYFRDCITNGKIKSGMVPWGKSGQLKPDDIENVIAYIHTFAPKK
jgi:mono/diheme cytochrome c family protein